MTQIAQLDLPRTKELGPLTRTDIVRYVAASGDFNPLHHDELAAREAGFPSVFSVGMLQAAILGACADEWFGTDGLLSFKVRFQSIVWPGDALTCRAEPTIDRDQMRLTVELTCHRQGDDLAVSGEAVYDLTRVRAVA